MKCFGVGKRGTARGIDADGVSPPLSDNLIV